MAHPDERMQRASHALAVDGNVWVVDPVDADGLDGELADTGFELVWEKDGAGWKEGALYHPDRRALVVPDALMTAFFAEVDGRLEVFPLFR